MAIRFIEQAIEIAQSFIEEHPKPGTEDVGYLLASVIPPTGRYQHWIVVFTEVYPEDKPGKPGVVIVMVHADTEIATYMSELFH